MAYPRTPGGLFPLTTAPTGNNAGGQYPTTDRLDAAIRSLAPTAYWRLGDVAGPLLDAARFTSTTITLATSADADDIVDTVEDHGFVTGDTFTFATLTGGSNVTAGTTYHVIATSLAAKTFKFSATAGGAAVDFGSDITAGTIVRAAPSFWNAAVTGSPTYAAAAPSPIGSALTLSGSEYANTSTSVPTPSASVSVLVLIATTNSAASNRVIVSRAATNQYSWDMRLVSTHRLQFTLWQSGAAAHATVSPTGAVNDGAWHLALGTFDGTTALCYRDNAAVTSSTSLTGTWHTASTAAVQIGRLVAGNPYTGSAAHIAYWSDRVITDAERLWVYNIAKGG